MEISWRMEDNDDFPPARCGDEATKKQQRMLKPKRLVRINSSRECAESLDETN